MTRFSVPIAALAMALSPPATAVTVSDASWLVGRWVGEGLGGHAEEIWSPGKNGRMVGHFQFTDGSQPDFYELMLIDEQAGGLRLRVKHFNADFTAWEDKGEWHSFDPVSVSPNLLKFDGLTIARDGDGMTSTVTVKGSDGVVRDISFRFRRAAD